MELKSTTLPSSGRGLNTAQNKPPSATNLYMLIYNLKISTMFLQYLSKLLQRCKTNCHDTLIYIDIYYTPTIRTKNGSYFRFVYVFSRMALYIYFFSFSFFFFHVKVTWIPLPYIGNIYIKYQYHIWKCPKSELMDEMMKKIIGLGLLYRLCKSSHWLNLLCLWVHYMDTQLTTQPQSSVTTNLNY